MASNVAPPKNTGGGGFVFENDVCAWLLASMLAGDPVFGVDYGPAVRIDFQTRPDGWFLDDVLVTTSLGAIHHHFALSVKSNAQFTATSAPSDFVALAWEQMLHIGSSTFDDTVDFMGLVTAPLSGAATHSLSGLAEKVRANDPNLFSSRLATPNWASADERHLFASFACPESLGRATTDADTARLLQRLRFIQRDFGFATSEWQNRALELCRLAVRSQTMADAQTLWSILRELASELRPQAGSLTLFDLVDRLRARVVLDDYPDHRGDWAKLDARSTREAGLVRASIADRVQLRRDEHVAEVIRTIAANVQFALLGPSGVGKSALAKAAFEQRASRGQRTLWIDASSLDRAADFGGFEASLQLQHSLVDLLAMEASREPVVVLDGLDRLYADVSLRTVATLLKSASGGPQATKWRLVAVCQSQEWPRVLEGLQRAGAPLTPWLIHEAAGVQPEALRPVRDVVPSLARLLLQPQVGSLLTNLKLLDLVVRRLVGGTHIDASGWVGESSVAEWFWTAEVDRGPDRLARGQFVRGLAQVQADQLVASVAVDALDASSLIAAQSLTNDQLLVQVDGDSIAFAHDLYGDWARLRVLLNHRDNLAAFIQTRHESPLWHRALRLLGIHLLEREHGIAQWRALLASFNGTSLTVVRDLLLEAPAFSMNAGPLLQSIFPDLVAGDGELLRRLLTRFLAFATVPDERTQEIARAVGMDANAARAAYRRPHWPYWLDVIAVLHTNRVEASRVASSELAKVVEMWLEFVPPGSARRSEATDLAVLLGQTAVDSRDDYRNRDERGLFYKCALMAAPERPDEVALLAKTAAERIPRPAVPVEEPTPPAPRPRSMFSTGIVRGPWPDGPLARIDVAFQSIVLDTNLIQPLYRERPMIAREVILAALIDGPHEEYWGSSRLYERELDLVSRHKWQPALYTQGPFLMCLRQNFAEGLELVMRLVDFATARAVERAEQERSELRSQALADGHAEAEVDLVMAAAPARGLSLLNEDSNVLRFEGDATIYGWSSGLGNPPNAVEVGLMALEQYFYLRLDAGDDISDEISAVLARTRSVAILGVLCDIGKRQTSLFDGPLRALLSAPELYSWEISGHVHGRSHLMIGAVMQGQVFLKLARQFHRLEHRKRDLRHIAVQHLLNSEGMKTYFATTREWWRSRKANGEHLNEIAEQLDQLLDPSNYEIREDAKQGTILVNVALERGQAEKAIEIQAINDRMLVSGFPMRCRSILDDRKLLSDAQLDELWQAWLRIRELAKAGQTLPRNVERFGDEFVNAITGGIAVLLWHDGWASQDSTRQQDIEITLEKAMSEGLPKRNEFSTEHDASAWTWDCFVAEAAAILWARHPEDIRWRRLVASMVFAEKYLTVRLLFARCAEFRTTLGSDFERLRRLALDWAHVRDRVDVLRSAHDMIPPLDEQFRERLQAHLARWAEQSVSSFVEGSLAPPPVDWSRFGDENRFVEIDNLHRRWPEYRLMDFHLVRCSHEWLPQPVDAQSPEERASIVQFWRVALEVVVRRPRSDLQRRDHQFPQEDEVWVLNNVAAAVLELRPAENPEYFWNAIIDLHSEAHDWPEMFLTALHRQALAADETPATYAPLLRGIAQRAFSDVEGMYRWPAHEEVWDALLGIDYCVSDLWSDRHSDHVQSIWDVYSLWMDKAPQDGRRLAKFARWLSKAAAASIRLRVLTWFASELQYWKDRSANRDGNVDEELAKLLNVIWDKDQPLLRATEEAFAAFRELLTWLVERQNSMGLELQGRIGRLA
jgi:hypothetical protein